MWSMGAGIADASCGELAQACHTIAAELAARPAPESGPAALEAAELVGGAADLMEAALATLVERVDSTGAHGAHGFPSVVSWLRERLGMRHGRAVERATVARQLPRLERLRKLLTGGGLSFGYASAVCGATPRLDDEDAAVAEEILLGMVEDGCAVGQVAKAGDRITDLVAERVGREKEPGDAKRGFARSWMVRSKSLDGGSWFKGWCTPEHTAALDEIVGPLAKPRAQGDDRDIAQRTADALFSVLTEGNRGAGVTLIIDLAAYTAATGDTGPFTHAPRPAPDSTTPAPSDTATATGTAAATCTGDTGTDRGSGTETDRDGNTGTGSSTDRRCGHGHDRDHGSGGTGTGTDSHPGTGSGTGTDSHPGTGSGTGTDSHPGTGSGTGTDSHPGTGSGTGTDSHTGTGSGTGTDCGSGNNAPENIRSPKAPKAPGERVRPDPHDAAMSGPKHGIDPEHEIDPEPGIDLAATGGSQRIPARLLDGTPISPEDARRIALNAGISAVVLGRGGIPLYLGRSARFATAGQRKVLLARYDTCCVVGCRIPAHLCEIHHLNGGWKLGTPTDIDQLVPMCGWHNRWIETHADQAVQVTDDQGRTILKILPPGTSPRGTAKRGTVGRGTAQRGTVGRGTVGRGTAQRGTEPARHWTTGDHRRPGAP